MTTRSSRIYRQHRPIRTILTVLLVLIATLILLTVTAFFSFRRYIVYSDNGVELVVPWLEETTENTNEETD